MMAVLLGTLFVAVSIGVLRLHPFLALTLGAILAGSVSPSETSAPERVHQEVEATGGAFGDLVGAIGITIALAAVTGDGLLRSGASAAEQQRREWCRQCPDQRPEQQE